MLDPKRITNWNEEAGNKKGKFDPRLAKRLIMEEVRETRMAIDEENKVEIVDGIIDTIVVGIGELHKLGLTPEQITDCYNEVCDSNDSKKQDGEFIKNEQGKIMKGKNYKKPDLKKILKGV